MAAVKSSLGRNLCFGLTRITREEGSNQEESKNDKSYDAGNALLHGEILGILHGEKIPHHIEICESEGGDTIQKNDGVNESKYEEEARYGTTNEGSPRGNKNQGIGSEDNQRIIEIGSEMLGDEGNRARKAVSRHPFDNEIQKES